MSDQVAIRTHAEVPYDLFIGIMWTFTAVSLTFVLARITIKLRTFRRIFWDDALVILAWFMLLTTAILWKYNIHYVYQNYEMVRGERPFGPDAIRDWDTFMRLIIPVNVLFYSGLWAVKLSFLLFFRSFGAKIRSYEIYWWVVLVITVIGYIGCIADMQYECTVPYKPVEWVLQNCATQSKIDWVNKTFYANCALDLLSDLLILSIPIIILWNVGVGLRKKIILCCIFSATIAIMVVAVIRVAVVNSRHQNTEVAWLYFWTFVENGTAIMIACVASFRQLFVATHEQPGSSSPAKNSSQKSYFRIFSTFKSSSKGGSIITEKSQPSKKYETSNRSSEGQDSIAPLEFVTIHGDANSSSSHRT